MTAFSTSLFSNTFISYGSQMANYFSEEQWSRCFKRRLLLSINDDFLPVSVILKTVILCTSFHQILTRLKMKQSIEKQVFQKHFCSGGIEVQRVCGGLNYVGMNTHSNSRSKMQILHIKETFCYIQTGGRKNVQLATEIFNNNARCFGPKGLALDWLWFRR